MLWKIIEEPEGAAQINESQTEEQIRRELEAILNFEAMPQKEIDEWVTNRNHQNLKLNINTYSIFSTCSCKHSLITIFSAVALTQTFPLVTSVP